MKLVIITKIPSPYQVELFDAVSAKPEVDLDVVYVRSSDPDRQWAAPAKRHRAHWLDSKSSQLGELVLSANLVVFSWYRDEDVMDLMRIRVRSGGAWCFWGERPGFSHKGWLGRAYRRWKLRSLWRDPRVPIWGIGHWALEGYRREFGGRRAYYHVPYVSDLSSFFSIDPVEESDGDRTILFSGSLIERKGIEELCNAFSRVSRRRNNVRLLVLGTGPLEERLRRTFCDNPQIEFLGFRQWNELASIYRRARLLCAPSRYDGWGLIVPEAMASGMPVIASSQVGSAREMVVDGKTGWLVAPRDEVAIERAIETALDAPRVQLDAMAQECRRVAASYGIEPGAQRLVAAAERSLAGWR